MKKTISVSLAALAMISTGALAHADETASISGSGDQKVLQITDGTSDGAAAELFGYMENAGIHPVIVGPQERLITQDITSISMALNGIYYEANFTVDGPGSLVSISGEQGNQTISLNGPIAGSLMDLMENGGGKIQPADDASIITGQHMTCIASFLGMPRTSCTIHLN